jgi:hypothetical protein
MQSAKVKITSAYLPVKATFHLPFCIFQFLPVRYKIISRGEQSAIFSGWLQNLTQIPEPVRNRF